MTNPVKIFGIAGSLRKGSYNRAALRAAQQLVPQGATLESFDIAAIPPFSEDIEKTPPAVVTDLKTGVRAADAVLFVTPEYNYSIPGVLKNAIDWGSRPYGDSCWEGKPVAVMGASIGTLGSARAQYHLRQCFVFLNMFPINRPEVMISQAAQRFDQQGNLTDDMSKQLIRELLQNLIDWTNRLRGAPQR
ncbi:MAG TPA: NAD(P)H-dependent oxidoreductase [Clostridia bacterium]|nr:NAD(P)H-dependent oxidoreductase [Clostridia bacterium]